uniref:RING-type domain-containing protein n=1 Tax=Mycena chlorophos TaxID=658473 RepID=A0ABQ0L5U8_MYCCL|nr:predicted protein [Mycena chlorophos]
MRHKYPVSSSLAKLDARPRMPKVRSSSSLSKPSRKQEGRTIYSALDIERPFVTLGSTASGRATLCVGEKPVHLQRQLQRPMSKSLHAGWRLHRSRGVKRAMLLSGVHDPPYLEPLSPHHRCSICWGVKAHPVLSARFLFTRSDSLPEYPRTDCGHTFCFCCLRVWLQTSWRCPECMNILRETPRRNIDVQQWLLEAYPKLAEDESRPTYDFSSLVFPTI